ncbi:MAG: ATP-binding protein [Gammaproteobacteria bacterium]|nr:ATP-binding protein [Gammaproteobacteria bacterium]
MNPSMFTELKLATKSIELFANTLRIWFQSAVVGGLIYGTSRAGKSYAIEYITTERKKIFGYDIPIITIQWKITTIHEKDFHVRLLSACSHSVPSTRTTNPQLEHRIVEYITGLAKKSGESNVIIIIDEAQDMRLSDLGYLANIYNQLKKNKIQQYTFLVGERKLLELRGKANDAGYARYIGRFMCADFEFPLIQSYKDLQFILTQYDQHGYPEGSGTSIVEKILPKSYSAGWRLASNAKDLWSGFLDSQKSTGRRNKKMTMQSCTILIAQLFHRLSKRDGGNLKLTKDDINASTELIKHLHNS